MLTYFATVRAFSRDARLLVRARQFIDASGDGDLAADGAPVDIATAAVRRRGSDVTIVTYGGSLPTVMTATDELAGRGIDAEVVDLRVLRPLDDATVMASVRATHRVVVVDEGWRSVGLAAEVSARVMEQAFYDLDAPVARVCTREVPIPYARHLELAAIPSVERVLAAVEGVTGAHV